MASASYDQLLRCDICLEKLKSPRALPCLHSFCKECIQRHIESPQHGFQTKTQFPCPTCRKKTLIPKDGSDGFPIDFRMNQISEVLEGIEKTENQKYLLCEICLDHAFEKTAKKYCLDCKKYFCILCSTKHQISKVLKTHKLVDVYNFDEQIAACTEHKKEQIKFLCQTCDLGICVLCVLGNHEHHTISSFEDIYVIKGNKITHCLNHIEDQISLLNGRIFDITCIEGRNRSMYVEQKLSARTKYKRTHVNKPTSNLDDSYKTCCRDLKREKDICYQYLEQFKMIQEKFESILKRGNTEILLQSHSHILQEVLNIDLKSQFERSKLDSYFMTGDNTAAKQSPFTGHYHITKPTYFLTNSTTNQRCSSRNVHKGVEENFLTILPVNEEKIKQTHTRISTDTHLNRCLYQLSSMVLPRQPYNPAKYQSGKTPGMKLIYKIEGYGRRPGSLNLPFGIDFLPDDSLVVAENGNGRIQKFSRYGISMQCITLKSGYPRCITTGKYNEIFVTDEFNKCVKKVSMETESNINYSKECIHFPYGIVALSNGDLVVSDMIYERLTIIKSSGETALQFGSHGYTDSTFDNPSYLATDGQNIIVSDSGHHQVKVFDKNGKFLHKYGNFGSDIGELKYPKGVAVARQGQIIVADSGNNRVVMYHTTGNCITLLDINDDIDRPIDVACSPSGLLAVAMPDKNQICVYKLYQSTFDFRT